MSAGEDTVFGRIVRGEIPAELLFEDDRCVVIRDIAPRAPTHLLVLPKEPIKNLSAAEPRHEALLGHLLLVAAKVARSEGVGDGFRIVVNNGAAAGQTVFHLHVHVLGGRTLGWPPG